MASTIQLFIFGLFIAFTTFTVAAPPPELITESFLECRRRIADLSEPVIRCISNEFSPDKEYKTRSLYNTTTACIQCKHVCRRRVQIKECLRQGVKTMKRVSNRAKTMLPSSVYMVDTIANYFCENEEEMFLGLTDEDMSCFRDSWGYCNPCLDFIHNMEAVVLCDLEDSYFANLYTMEYVCKNSVDFFDCSSNFTSACSNRLASTFATLKSTLLTSASCEQYYELTNDIW
ncbi:uncharacterized protein LOC124154390 isoform X2 [Ischnura elegans]|uniref:uncharacterized protein LOC124154390 isoform X2 n=1 Tax=Ischnura elegans TaxID=197161 RepID=UPI001ED8B6E2|nr:uncharacterized protein LOC124154390 isoform X2 [Ischnura elegans]XP_046384041.1 uncharacterized protein LOC124154390 isoform X2 [Ischnura elegans]